MSKTLLTANGSIPRKRAHAKAQSRKGFAKKSFVVSLRICAFACGFDSLC